MKNHSITFGFNNPENPGSTVEAKLWLGGKSHVKQRNDLHSRYNGTSKGTLAEKEALNYGNNGIQHAWGEISARASSADAA